MLGLLSAYLFDVDGNRLIDYYCGMGAMLLGHTPRGVQDAVKTERGAWFVSSEHDAGVIEERWWQFALPRSKSLHNWAAYRVDMPNHSPLISVRQFHESVMNSATRNLEL
ncbi:MAG: Glutamate-semialdehyde aminotransferase [Devosia sp.]|nr:Glutamate-semialdehyde aminotransferase [Devosia sp.]